MDMTTVWWVVFFVLVGAEMLSGTFYLLMVALGMAAAALASYANTTLTQQIALAACVSAGSVALWHLRRARRTTPTQAQSLDVGQTVHVAHWQADGTANVHYRGAAWTASLANPTGIPTPGAHRITLVDGARLRVEPVSAGPVPTSVS